jgi:hypothetical protein
MRFVNGWVVKQIERQRVIVSLRALWLFSVGWLATNSLAADRSNDGKAESKLQRPPFHGTIFDFPDLMRPSDATAFQGLTFIEQGERSMFDRRLDRFATFGVFIFRATFADWEPLEIAVNREFESQAAAQKEAEFYGTAFGRLPLFLRKEINALHIQAGDRLFGGGRNVLIHTGQGEKYQRDGILEETLAHEAAHALDAKYARHPSWKEAQQQDGQFISKYAQENPYREDIAESLIPYFAVRMRPERITAEQRAKIEQTIPARIKFLDSLQPEGFYEP